MICNFCSKGSYFMIEYKSPTTRNTGSVIDIEVAGVLEVSNFLGKNSLAREIVIASR